MNVANYSETALVKPLEETDVTVVGYLGFLAVDESGKIHGPIDLDHCFVL